MKKLMKSSMLIVGLSLVLTTVVQAMHVEMDGLVIMEAHHYGKNIQGKNSLIPANSGDLGKGMAWACEYDIALEDVVDYIVPAGALPAVGPLFGAIDSDSVNSKPESSGDLAKPFPGRWGNADAAMYANAPHLIYPIDFSTPGTYSLWVRGLALHDNFNSFHYGVDGVATSTGFGDSGNVYCFEGSVYLSPTFRWASIQRGPDPDIPTKVTIPSAGVHTLDIWPREPGVMLDRILLTTDPNMNPQAIEVADPNMLPKDALPESSYTPSLELRTDLNGDDMVNTLDFAIFANDWLIGTEPL